jgi:hypothetical protein
MQDQTAQLEQMGIPAAVLNSSRMRRAIMRFCATQSWKVPTALSFAGASGAGGRAHTWLRETPFLFCDR